jgi:type II secretory pathway pseudopilin PulG
LQRYFFSLTELLVVMTILVIIAGSAVGMFSIVQKDSQLKLIHVEMAEIRKALLRYRKDLGHFPKLGVSSFDNIKTRAGLANEVPGLSLVNHGPNMNEDTFDSQVNMYQLLVDPFDGTFPYEPAYSRGWNGPYLGKGYHHVTIGENNANKAMGPLLDDHQQLLAIPDRTTKMALGNGLFKWSLFKTNGWETVDAPVGRPYSYELNQGAKKIVLRSAGLNGIYNDADDVTLELSY